MYKSKSIIYSAILKNGYNNFNLEIIEYCDEADILNREQYYLNLLKPKYNILKVAGSSLGYRHSDITKGKMSILNTKEKHPFFGKKHTEESKLKMSLSRKAFYVKVIDVITNKE